MIRYTLPLPMTCGPCSRQKVTTVFALDAWQPPRTFRYALDVGRLVIRHAAVVGSTGAGKTSTVATLLQRLARGGWPAANIVVIDPHGEYASALGPDAAVSSVLA